MTNAPGQGVTSSRNGVAALGSFRDYRRVGLIDDVDAAWATALGTTVGRLRAPGIHRVRGGASLRAGGRVLAYEAVLGDTTLLYPEQGPENPFHGCETVYGPSAHAFVDAEHFIPPGTTAIAGPVTIRDLADLRCAAGEDEWTGSGFAESDDPALFALHLDSVVVAAGNLTPYRGRPADVGLLVHPDHRGRGHGLALAGAVVTRALPGAGIVRWRALTTNEPSLRIATTLGFQPRGINRIALGPSA